MIGCSGRSCGPGSRDEFRVEVEIEIAPYLLRSDGIEISARRSIAAERRVAIQAASVAPRVGVSVKQKSFVGSG
jgi:predicted DNA-binding helix-hairpin-helix protein